MARTHRIVTFRKKTPTDRLPEWAQEAAVLLQWLEEHHLLQALADRLKIRRQGGYVGLDLVLFLLCFLSAHLPGGLKGFDHRAHPHRRALAALGNRKQLPARSSVSRLLAATEDEHTQSLAPWLLLEGAHAQALLQHPAGMTRDTQGTPWQIFDLDPSITTLRQRALPEGEDLPEARRRAQQAQPGYTGRKRGDVQLSRMTLQHAGSAAWLGLWMAPGNGAWREQSRAAVKTVRTVCDQIQHPPQHTLIRVDGAGGNVPFLTACQDAEVCYLTRWSHYELLEDPVIRAHLNTTDWFEVDDSGSGPRRQAAELGWVVLQAAEATRRPDGSPFAPVRSRMVVSRFCTETKRGAGVLIEGWQYELYVTLLLPEAWPAPEVVTSYYGRCGQENRFGQEDRELELDHIFSYHVPGQQFASLLGLWLWNLRLSRGLEIANPPQILPAQVPRVVRRVHSPVPLSLPHGPEPMESSDAPPVAPSPLAPPPPTALEGVAVSPSEIPSAPSLSAVTDAERTDLLARSVLGDRGVAGEALSLALDRLDWPTYLWNKSDWQWSREAGGVLCPRGSVLTLQSIAVRGADQTRSLRFLAPFQACTDCPVRSGCTSSTSPLYRKELALTVATEQAHSIHMLLARHRGQQPPRPPAPVPKHSPSPRVSLGLPRDSVSPLSAVSSPARPPWAPPSGGHSGSLSVRPPVLLPAQLRHLFSRTCMDIEVHLQVQVPQVPPPVKVFALTPGERQHCRRTWAQRHQWNALPSGSQVQIQFDGGATLASILSPSQGDDSAEEAA